jgi:hypothetical protein
MTEQYTPHPVDIKDSYILTRVLNEKQAESDLYDVPFAPLYPFNGRKVRLVVKMHEGAGLAAFKADNAGTPIIPAVGSIEERYIELALIAEKDTLESSTLIELASMDDRVARLAAEDVLEKAMRLQQRNVNRTRWMAYMAARDELDIIYGSVTLDVDFDLNGDGQNQDRFSDSHLPTQSDGLGGTDWSTTSADIIEDVHTCAKLIGDDLGIDETDVVMHVNSDTYRYIWKNDDIQGYLSDASPRVTKPQRNEAATICEIAEIVIDNSFYYTYGATGTTVKTKLIPEGYALFMPRGYEYKGAPIMEMYDGLVARVVGNEIVVERNPGMVAEMYVSKEQIAQNVRVQTARMPVMNFPAAFVYAHVYTA